MNCGNISSWFIITAMFLCWNIGNNFVYFAAEKCVEETVEHGTPQTSSTAEAHIGSTMIEILKVLIFFS